MAQRRIKTQYKQISQEIDFSLLKIDQLLARLNPKRRGVLGSIDNVCESIRVEQFRIDLSSKPILEESTLNMQQSDDYQFLSILDSNTEQMLLQSFPQQYDSRYLSSLTLSQPLIISVETRSNWIKKYLDEGDCTLFLQNDGQFLQIISIENGILSYMNSQYQYVKVKSQQIYQWSQVNIRFDNFTAGYTINTSVEGVAHVYEMTLERDSRVIFRAQSESHQVQRIILINENYTTCSKYQVAWGNYFQGNMLENVKLEAGKYILMSIGTTTVDTIDILLENPEVVSFRTAPQNLQKTRNLLMQTFPELQGLDSPTSNRQIKQEYVRSVYIDIGIVIEVYENIYLHECIFEDQQPVREDLSLLFPSLYTKNQIENRLRRGQRMIKFLSIEAKPAHLFVPRKHVRTGSQIMEDFKAHSVFK